MLKSFLNNIIKEDGFLLETSDKKTYTIGNPVKEKPVKLKLHNKSIEYKLALFSDYYFGKGFVDGEITIEQGDLSEILDIALKNIGRKDISEFSKIVNKIRGTWRYLTNFNTRRSSRAAVEHHYEIGSVDFYKTFIDNKHFQYSTGYHPRKDMTLEDSQEAMINHMIKKLDIKDNDKILDCGSGFGGLACAIAEKTGARVDGITLSKVQLDFSQKLAREKKLDNLCQFRIEDYRDTEETYTKVVSKGMLEHVTRKRYHGYFRQIYKMLEPKGKALIHTIGSIDKPRDPQAWITTFIFPSGYTPSASELMPAIESASLVLQDWEVLSGIHYSSTIRNWKIRFIKNKEKILKMYDETFYRLWLFYLSSCESAFRWTDMCNFQILLNKDSNTSERTRDYMYTPKKVCY